MITLRGISPCLVLWLGGTLAGQAVADVIVYNDGLPHTVAAPSVGINVLRQSTLIVAPTAAVKGDQGNAIVPASNGIDASGLSTVFLQGGTVTGGNQPVGSAARSVGGDGMRLSGA